MNGCFVLLVLSAVVRAQTIAFRGRQQHLHEHKRARAGLHRGHATAVLMPSGVMACPDSQRITSEKDCEAAFGEVITKYNYVYESTEVLAVSWRHFPKGCSVSKGKAYFNTDSSPATSGDSAVGVSLNFHAVCAQAAYKEFAHTVFCRGAVLYNGGGSAAGRNQFENLRACQEECDQDPRCNFFLWKQEQGTSWERHCATFAHCNKPEIYTDGKMAQIFKKIAEPMTAKQPGALGADHSFQMWGSNPADVADSNMLHLHSLQRQQLRAENVPIKPEVPRNVSKAKVTWYACELVGGHERIVWTKWPKNMVILTKVVRRKDCPKEVGKQCMHKRFYTGKWSIEGGHVVLKWDFLPPMRLSTVDGGQNFHYEDHQKVKRYSCTAPPVRISKLIKDGIKEAQAKLAEEQRTKAGMPTAFSGGRCLEFPVQPLNPLVLARDMSLGKCFAHCAKTKGMSYFSVTRGDSCFCSATPPGEPADSMNCDLTCSGSTGESCGGFSNFASVYTMIDCLPPGPQELKEDEIARTARLRALYTRNSSQSCGQAKGNDIEVDGSTIFTGYPHQCEQMCLAGKGAGKCHGFTYNEKKVRCTFHMDAFWGEISKDPHSSCYFKKSVPLVG